MPDEIARRGMDSAPKDARDIWVLFADGVERVVAWWDCSWLREDMIVDRSDGTTIVVEGDSECTDCWREDDGNTHEACDAIGWRPYEGKTTD